MRVLLVDDNRLMLEGLQGLLTPNNIQIVGMATDGFKALELARSLRPEVILMDIRMPVCDGLKATRLIKAEMPEVQIVVLTTSDEDQDLFDAVKSGACGYLLKSMDTEELIEALNQVQKGIPPFSPGLAIKLLEEFTRLGGIADAVAPSDTLNSPEVIPTTKLSARQHEVLALVAQGLSYKEAGAKLGLSPRTIKYHMVEIMQGLHLRNRAQVLAYAGQLARKCSKSDLRS